MKVPFPGMNPFIEGQEWEDFHSRFHSAFADALSPRLRPKYAARVERRIYIEEPFDDEGAYLRADVAIVRADEGGGVATLPASRASLSVEGLVPLAEEHRETYLVIRHLESQEVVTVIETLSPTNKRRGSVGQREYLEKRGQILKSQTSLVEIDLLREGSRLPMRSRLPAGDYYAIICPRWKRPRATIHPWRLDEPLPTIAIPLKEEDGCVDIDLQQVVATVCERADYDLTIDYSMPLVPPLTSSEEEWLKSLLLPVKRAKAGRE